MKKLSICSRCKKPTRTFRIEVAEDEYTVVCDAMPVLQGIFRITDLVTNTIEVADPAPYQYQAHHCGAGEE